MSMYKIFSAPALMATLFLSVGCASGLKDIRPEAVKSGISADDEAKARAMLLRAAENAGGQELLNQHAGFRTEMDDVWESAFAKLMFLRYEPEQKIVVEAAGPRVDNVTMTLVDGERAGEVWGLEDNNVYIQEKGGEKEFTDDEITMLYIKNPASLVLLPLRLAYADKVGYLGTVDYEGKTYEQLFVTWETLDTNAKFDQWIVWIDPETGNIAKAKFTIREYTGMLGDEAVVELEDYQKFGDVTIPTKIRGLFALDDADPIRTWTVTSFAWTDEMAEAVVGDDGPASQPAKGDELSFAQ